LRVANGTLSFGVVAMAIFRLSRVGFFFIPAFLVLSVTLIDWSALTASADGATPRTATAVIRAGTVSLRMVVADVSGRRAANRRRAPGVRQRTPGLVSGGRPPGAAAIGPGDVLAGLVEVHLQQARRLAGIA
jgi:hypothetical protein